MKGLSPLFVIPCLILLAAFVIGGTIGIIIGIIKLYRRNALNTEALAQLLHSKVEASFFFQTKIKGTYAGRRITFLLYRDKYDFHTYFYVEPKGREVREIIWLGGSLLAFFFWNPTLQPDRQITKYTHVYNGDVIAYTYMPKIACFDDPELRADKRTLWALLNTKLSEDDLRFFLDELIRAADIMEKEESGPYNKSIQPTS